MPPKIKDGNNIIKYLLFVLRKIDISNPRQNNSSPNPTKIIVNSHKTTLGVMTNSIESICILLDMKRIKKIKVHPANPSSPPIIPSDLKLFKFPIPISFQSYLIIFQVINDNAMVTISVTISGIICIMANCTSFIVSTGGILKPVE